MNLQAPTCKHNVNWNTCTECRPGLLKPTVNASTVEEENWKDSYKGKLWSTAVQKAFEAPFVEVAIQHLLFAIDKKHQQELSGLSDSTLWEVLGEVGEDIKQPSTTLVEGVDEFIWHENNGRNSERQRIRNIITKRFEK